MIEFNGEVDMKCRYYVAKKLVFVLIKSFLLPIIIMGIPAVIIFFNRSTDSFARFISLTTLIILGIVLIGVIALLIISKFPTVAYNMTSKTINPYIPNEITIDDEIINLECENTGGYGEISDVKKVIDFGEWYYIKFYFPYKGPHCICQKNLITKGSIEEFEKLFEGKIVRVNSRKNKCE